MPHSPTAPIPSRSGRSTPPATSTRPRPPSADRRHRGADHEHRLRPAGASNAASASFAFSGSDAGGSGIASFECRRDSASFAPCTSPQAYAALADGAHTFEVRAIDTAGNVDQTPASFSWTVDTAAPTTSIDSGPPALSNAASASFAFSGSDAGGSGVASFECRRDGASFAPCTSPQAYAALADGAHSFEVRAIDAAGNVDQTPATFSWSIDTAAPTTNIDSNPPALSNAGSASFAFSGTDAGGSGVASFECRIDSTQAADWGSCSSPKSYSNLSEGAHKFEVRAIDQAGNVDQTPASFSWSIDTVAPTTSIDSNPPVLSNAASASFAFSGTDAGGSGVASFECRRDSAAFAPCTSPQAYAALADGGHSFEVRAIDQAGNVDQTPASFSWSIDTAAPTTSIDSSPPALSNAASASFAFSGSDAGGSGIASFECRRDGASFAPCTSPQAYAALADGAHSFEVRAIDTAGNVDATPATFSWTIDTAAPTTSIDSSPPALSNAGSASFAFSGTDAGGSGVASFECRRDGASFAPCTSPQAYASLADGAHSFEVRAIDTAGNVDQSPASFSWTIDTAAPTTSIDSGPPALSNAGSASFAFSGTDAGGSGVASFECRRDGAAFTPCTSPQAYAALADGSHSFEVRAIDTAGNVDQTPASFSWSIDTAAPTTNIDSSPPALSNAASASFAFSGTDAGGSGVASFECRRDGASFAPCTSPQAYAALADGAHSFEVRAIDAAGNVDQTPASFSWSIDTAAPTTNIDSSPPALSGSPSANFAFSGSDAGGSGVASFECRRDGASFAPCTSPQAYAALADGAHTFEVRAIDTAGNADQSPATFTWTIDTAAPNTTIDSSPPALSNAASANFAFSGSDAGGSGVASFECRIDSTQAADWGSCSSPKSYSNLSDGAHTFEVRAIDQAGNVDQTPASFSWSIDTAAPTTNIDSSPPALSNAASASFAFSGSDAGGSGVASFECRRDGASFAPCTSPQAYAALADGAHSFEVRAIDTAGNVDQSPASFSWTIDTAAPTTNIDSEPAGAEQRRLGQLRLLGERRRRLRRRLVRMPHSTAQPGGPAPRRRPMPHSPTAPIPSRSGRSTPPATSTRPRPPSAGPIDTAAPTTTIDSSPPALSNAASASFAFSGTDAGGSGVASFECRRDGASFAPCTSPQAYAALADGAHSFEVRAIDTAGNVDQTPATFSWSIDTAAPTTNIDSNPPALSNAASANFAFSGTDAGGSGVASFECRIDSTQAADWGSCSSPKSYSNLSDGAHKFEVRAIDTAGNVDQSPATFSWTIDTAAPTTTIDSSPPALSNAGSASFAFSGTDAGGSGVASFECRRDGASFAPCTSPQAYASLADGAHSFEVRAIDTAGNVDQSPASFSWTIDTAAPTTSIDSGPPALMMMRMLGASLGRWFVSARRS